MSPPHVFVEALTPKVTVFGGWGGGGLWKVTRFRRGHEWGRLVVG